MHLLFSFSCFQICAYNKRLSHNVITKLISACFLLWAHRKMGTTNLGLIRMFVKFSNATHRHTNRTTLRLSAAEQTAQPFCLYAPQPDKPHLCAPYLCQNEIVFLPHFLCSSSTPICNLLRYSYLGDFVECNNDNLYFMC